MSSSEAAVVTDIDSTMKEVGRKLLKDRLVTLCCSVLLLFVVCLVGSCSGSFNSFYSFDSFDSFDRTSRCHGRSECAGHRPCSAWVRFSWRRLDLAVLSVQYGLVILCNIQL